MKKTLHTINCLTIAASFILIAAFANTLQAQTIYVNSSTGNDATGNGTSGNPYKTFHKGYTMASAGNTIDLTGTFTWTDTDETGDAATTGYTIGKNITIQGQGAGTTIVQANSAANTADRAVFTITSATTLKKITIRNGKTNSGYGGMNINTTSNVIINNFSFESNYGFNSSPRCGGAIKIETDANV
jgi:hypothetical protein